MRLFGQTAATWLVVYRSLIFGFLDGFMILSLHPTFPIWRQGRQIGKVGFLRHVQAQGLRSLRLLTPSQWLESLSG